MQKKKKYSKRAQFTTRHYLHLSIPYFRTILTLKIENLNLIPLIIKF